MCLAGVGEGGPVGTRGGGTDGTTATARVTVRPTPRVSRDEVVGFVGETLRVRVTAPPVDGRVNEALIRLLAAVLDVPRGDVRLVGGQTSREKVVAIDGLSMEEVHRRCAAHVEPR